jgi:hypothetical protein
VTPISLMAYVEGGSDVARRGDGARTEDLRARLETLGASPESGGALRLEIAGVSLVMCSNRVCQSSAQAGLGGPYPGYSNSVRRRVAICARRVAVSA